MNRFIPREKLSKKARRELDLQKRSEWSFSPVSRRVESKKRYSRAEQRALMKKSHDRNEYGMGFFYDCGFASVRASRIRSIFF